MSFICCVCNTHFTNREDFKQHIELERCGRSKLFPCNICKKGFSQSQCLKEHKKIHNGTRKKYFCGTCCANFTTKHSLIVHLRESICKEKRSTPVCNICNATFPKGEGYRQHIKKVGCRGTEIFPCNICKKSFSQSNQLKDHQEIHNVTRKKYICEACNFGFTQKHHLIRHIKNIDCKEKLTERIPRICSLCNSSFTTLWNFRQHIKTEGCAGIGRFLCNICNRSFCWPNNLRAHQQTHNITMKKYVCEACKVEFSHEGGLSIHLKMSNCKGSNAKCISRTCNICNVFFVKEKDFNYHIETMGCRGNENFPCNICNRSFSYLSSLKAHQDIRHAIENKYFCKICNASFTQKTLLNRHQASHDRERNLVNSVVKYTCNFCNSSFPEWQSFDNHIKTVGCGNECIMVETPNIFPVRVIPSMTVAQDKSSTSSSLIQPRDVMSSSVSILDHNFKVDLFQNTNSIDLSTPISLKVDTIKKEKYSELETKCNEEVETAVMIGDIRKKLKCILNSHNIDKQH